MSIRSSAVVLTSAVTLAGCDFLGPEPAPITRVTVPGCVTAPAGIFYYRNEGGDGSWIAPARNLPDSTFTIDATQRVTLAWSGISRWTILRVSVDELQRVGCSRPDNASHPTYSGSVQNWRADETLSIGLGNWYTFSSPNLNPNFTPSFTATPRSLPFDAFAYATSPTGQRIIGRRGLSPSAGSILPAFDFASSEPLPLGVLGVSMNPLLQNESGTVTLRYESGLGSRIVLGSANVAANSIGATVPRLPGSLERPDDVYMATLEVRGSSETSTSDYYRTVTAHFAPVVSQALAVGPIPLRPTVLRKPSASGRNTFDISAPVQQLYTGYAQATLTWSESTASLLFLTYTTEGYRGNGSTWDLSIPPDIPNAIYPSLGVSVGCSLSVRSESWVRRYGPQSVRYDGDIDRSGRPTCLVP